MTRGQWLSYQGKWLICTGEAATLRGQYVYLHKLLQFERGVVGFDEFFFGKDGVKHTVGGWDKLNDWVVYHPNQRDLQRVVQATFGESG
jgi:hypothetical protein